MHSNPREDPAVPTLSRRGGARFLRCGRLRTIPVDEKAAHAGRKCGGGDGAEDGSEPCGARGEHPEAHREHHDAGDVEDKSNCAKGLIADVCGGEGTRGTHECGFLSNGPITRGGRYPLARPGKLWRWTKRM